MRGVYYSACSLCYKTIAQFHKKCLLMRDCLLFRRLLLPESTVSKEKNITCLHTPNGPNSFNLSSMTLATLKHILCSVSYEGGHYHSCVKDLIKVLT